MTHCVCVIQSFTEIVNEESRGLCMHAHMNECMHKQMNGWMDGWMDR